MSKKLQKRPELAANCTLRQARPVVKREVLTDHEARLMVAMRNETPPMSLGKLAKIFEVSKTCAARICAGTRRGDATGVVPKAKRREW